MEGERLRCSACVGSVVRDERVQLFDNADSLWCHIAMVHAVWVPFECLLCPMMLMPTEVVLKRHYEQSHPGRVPKAIYTYEAEKKEQIMRIFSESQKLKHNERRPRLSDSYHSNRFAETTRSRASQNTSLGNESPFNNITLEATETTDFYADMMPQSSKDHDTKTQLEDSVMEYSFESANSHHENPSAVATKTTGATEHIEFADDNSKISLIEQKVSLRQAKNWCRLCQKQLTQSKTNHIWTRHMEEARYMCNECGTKMKRRDHMERHGRHKHKRQKGEITWTDRKEHFLPEYRAQYLAAFGENMTEEKPVRRRNRQHECALCGQMVGRTQNEAHVRQRHMIGKRFGCRLCEYTTHYLNGIRQHVKAHGITADCYWLDNQEATASEFVTACRQAFGSYAMTFQENQMEDPRRQRAFPTTNDQPIDLTAEELVLRLL